MNNTSSSIKRHRDEIPKQFHFDMLNFVYENRFELNKYHVATFHRFLNCYPQHLKEKYQPIQLKWIFFNVVLKNIKNYDLSNDDKMIYFAHTYNQHIAIYLNSNEALSLPDSINLEHKRVNTECFEGIVYTNKKRILPDYTNSRPIIDNSLIVKLITSYTFATELERRNGQMLSKNEVLKRAKFSTVDDLSLLENINSYFQVNIKKIKTYFRKITGYELIVTNTEHVTLSDSSFVMASTDTKSEIDDIELTTLTDWDNQTLNKPKITMPLILQRSARNSKNIINSEFSKVMDLITKHTG